MRLRNHFQNIKQPGVVCLLESTPRVKGKHLQHVPRNVLKINDHNVDVISNSTLPCTGATTPGASPGNIFVLNFSRMLDCVRSKTDKSLEPSEYVL
jgi:hypothetical protein